MSSAPAQRIESPQSSFVAVIHTDTEGRMVEVNRQLAMLLGYTPVQLLGQPVSMLRHAQMPKQLFADLWGTLKAGRPWVGLIQNRCANGEGVWLTAHVAPTYEAGVLSGYCAVYRRARAGDIAEAESWYRRFSKGQAQRLIILRGKVLQDSILHRINPLWNMSLHARLLLLAMFGPGLAVFCVGLVMAGWPLWSVGSAIAFGTLIAAYSGHWLGSDVAGRLRAARDVFHNIASGSYDDDIDVTRSDEPGSVLLGLKMMQVRLCAQLDALQTRAEETLRVRQGLDAAATALLLTDADLTVTYVNHALLQLFERAHDDLISVWQGLRAGHLVGANLHDLQLPRDAGAAALEDTKARLLALKSTYFTEIKAGSRVLSLILTPVNGATGQRLGYVVEWRDRTDAVEVEHEINAIVGAAAEGDFSRRINLRKSGRNNFFLQLVSGFNRVLDINTKALDEVVSVIDGLAEGDLTRTIEGDYCGTLAKIQGDVNRTVDQLNEIVGRIRAATDAIDGGAREIASMNATLTGQAVRQTQALDATAEEIGRVTESVQSNAEDAGRARQFAASAVDVAVRGGRAVDDVVATMQSIRQLSQKIAEITGVIDGIAFQTNILALNSAVEAARAGEHGRGFAVVAGEVRSLAQRAAAAAKEIKTLIGTSVEQIGRGSEQVGMAGQTMREIVESVQQVTGLVNEIAQASERQSEGIQRVNQVVTEVDEATRSNAAMVKDASISAGQLEQAAAALSSAVAIFKTQRGAAMPGAITGASGVARGRRRVA